MAFAFVQVATKSENVRSWDVTTTAVAGAGVIDVTLGTPSWTPDWYVFTPLGANGFNMWRDQYSVTSITGPTIVGGVVTAPIVITLDRFAAAAAATFRFTIGKNTDL